MYTYAYHWFLVYYFALGLVFLLQGLVWMKNPASFYQVLKAAAENNKRPSVFLKAIRYFALFTLISGFFTLYVFSFFELLFVIMSFYVVFASGSLLLKWDNMKHIILEKEENTLLFIKKFGLIMVIFAGTCFVLSYRFLLAHSTV